VEEALEKGIGGGDGDWEDDDGFGDDDPTAQAALEDDRDGGKDGQDVRTGWVGRGGDEAEDDEWSEEDEEEELERRAMGPEARAMERRLEAAIPDITLPDEAFKDLLPHKALLEEEDDPAERERLLVRPSPYSGSRCRAFIPDMVSFEFRRRPKRRPPTGGIATSWASTTPPCPLCSTL
jgi:hypothetical protein